MGFMDWFDKVGDSFKKLNDNPIVDHSIDWIGDFLMGKLFLKSGEGEQARRTIDPNWLRAEAPFLFARTGLDEEVFREITYSKRLHKTWRAVLFDRWGPDPAVANPNPALGQIGLHQWDDFRLGLVEAMFKTGPELLPLEGAAREAKIVELCAFLTELAKLPPPFRLGRLIKNHYCRPNEGDYKVVKFQRVRGVVFTTVARFATEFARWANDPGPTGFRELARRTAVDITAAGPIVRTALDDAAISLNNLAARKGPGRLMG